MSLFYVILNKANLILAFTSLCEFFKLFWIYYTITHIKYNIFELFLKTEQKKPTHFLDMIAQQILILELKMIKQGQNKISRALIWGKVGLCRPKMTRDMIKKKKQGFSKNVNLCYKIARKCKIWHFLKITVFTFFIISLVIFGLQRPTLPQIKALEILFLTLFYHF